MDVQVPVLESFALRVDPAGFRAALDGRPLDLEPKAFDVLVMLMSHAPRLVTKQEILDAIWKGTAVTDNALTRVVAQLRRAIGDDAHEAKYLETVPTRGYRWIAPVQTVAGADLSASAEASARPRRSAPSAREGGEVGPYKKTARPYKKEEQRGDEGSPQADAAGARRLKVVAGLAMLLLLTGIVYGVLRMRPGAPIAVPARQLTLSAGLDAFPALSPDGSRLAYSSDRSGSFEIFVRPVDGGVDRPLTSDGQQNIHAAWSPDGRVLAYHSMRRGGIWVVPIDGGAPKQVSPFGSRPAWSPDGGRLAFQSQPAADIAPNAWGATLPSTIWIVDIAAGAPRPLTARGRPAGGHSAPAWSGDGRHVAFATSGFAILQIWGMEAQGGEPFLLSGPVMPAYDPVYLPERGDLVFTGGGVLWRVGLGRDGRASVAPRAFLPVGVEGARHLSAAATGRVVMSGLSLQSSLGSVAVDRDGRLTSAPRTLTNDTRRRNSLPAFSPDGSRIAVTSSLRGGQPDIWLIDADGSRLVQLTTHPGADQQPSWLPDSRRVLFKALRDGHVGLWEIDVETRRERIVVDVGAIADLRHQFGLPEEAQISPDGTRVVFAAFDARTTTKALWAKPVAGGDAVRLTSGDPPTGFPAWSPDGQWIACDVREGTSSEIAVIPARGGTPRRLTDARGHSWVHGWSPDSTKIAYAGLRDGVWNLYWISRDGGPEQRVTDYTSVNTFVRYPAWSPKGDQIVFEFGEVRGNVWLVTFR
jgi:Tol biopolymer transport system component/DNA-binding winged helix-turn-helix (wHTH) protein